MNEIIKILEILSRRHQPQDVFRDFCRMSVCALSLQQMEEEYLLIVKRYDKEDVKQIAEMFRLLVNTMDQFDDVLGQVYMEIVGRWKSSALGQFFTPISLCEMMARNIYNENEYYRSFNDCACGSGRTLLAMAKQMKPYQLLTSKFYAEDLDPICVDMAAINFCLSSMQSRILRCNTLSMEIYYGYTIDLHSKGVPFITPIPENIINDYDVKPEIIYPEVVKTNPNDATQLKLFEPVLEYA